MPTLTPEERAEMEARLHEVQAKDREKYDQLQRHAQATYRAVEGWHLVPLHDRANRMVVRNLKTIKELRQGPPPAVTVGQAQQVNVASQQVNAVGDA